MPSHPPRTFCNGRYRVDRLLGKGGMALVFEAWDNRLLVHRAIKVLAPNLAQIPALRVRFEAEAQTMARLHHPHIVTIHDVVDEGDDVLMVMEFLEGGSLQDLVDRRGRLPPVQAVQYAEHLLQALGFAHEHGVIHRDIKPQNVLVTQAGVAKVADFGIARVLDRGAHVTRTGAIMGTLA